MIEKTITELHFSKTGKVSDKWESYLSYYDSLFFDRKNSNISLLEIGIQNGGSLDTWSDYFKSGERFIGCDIDPNCGKLTYADSRISVVVGDANKNEAYNSIVSKCNAFDIIIDDGSHISDDILNSFINYFPLLKPGGIYIVEDTHTLYNKKFGGGIINEYSAYAFFKKLIDLTGYEFWSNDISIENYFSAFFSKTSTPDFLLQGWIDSINFRNSIITIKKSDSPTHNKLGKRIIVGETALVQTWGNSFKNKS